MLLRFQSPRLHHDARSALDGPDATERWSLEEDVTQLIVVRLHIAADSCDQMNEVYCCIYGVVFKCCKCICHYYSFCGEGVECASPCFVKGRSLMYCIAVYSDRSMSLLRWPHLLEKAQYYCAIQS